MRQHHTSRSYAFGIALTLMVLARAVHAQSRVNAAPASEPPRLTIEPRRADGGSLIRVTIDGLSGHGDSIVAIGGEMAGEPLHFVAAANGRRQAIGAIPVDGTDSVVARVLVRRTSGTVDTLRLALPYPHQPPPVTNAGRSGPSRLRVDSRFTRPLDTATAARVERENRIARQIGRNAQNTPRLWTYPFLRPRAAPVTSRFGSGRVFNGRLTSRHLGVDYRGAKGEPIHAANRGVVALVAEFFLAGNVVYIDHGNGIVTAYFHMSKPEVAVGDTVERGQEIGLVGATGRVTGPHLHWSARYGALTINPADLLTLGAPFTKPDPVGKKRPR